MICKNDRLVKLDLQDAYFVVPVASQHHRFLRFIWNGVLYQYVCLPIALRSASQIFTKPMKPIIAHLLKPGIRLLIYLDDIYVNPGQFSHRSFRTFALSIEFTLIPWLPYQFGKFSRYPVSVYRISRSQN